MAEMAPSDRDGEYRLGFAGDTFNTAWYLARLSPDVTVSYMTSVGADALSQQMRAFAAQSGIDDSHVRVVPDRTLGLYLISLNAGERSFSYWRGHSAARTLADDPEALTRAMSGADLVYFSGITLAIIEPHARPHLLAALAAARQAGKRIAFDPNLRPRLWSTPDEMTETIMQGAAVSDIVLPSFEDEADWFSDESLEATIARYSGVGVQTIIVKNGAGPVAFRSGDEIGEVAVEPLHDPVDTTAAGDSFNAAILAGLAAGRPLAQSIAMACRLSRAVVQERGALVPVAADLLAT